MSRKASPCNTILAHVCVITTFLSLLESASLLTVVRSALADFTAWSIGFKRRMQTFPVLGSWLALSFSTWQASVRLASWAILLQLGEADLRLSSHCYSLALFSICHFGYLRVFVFWLSWGKVLGNQSVPRHPPSPVRGALRPSKHLVGRRVLGWLQLSGLPWMLCSTIPSVRSCSGLIRGFVGLTCFACQLNLPLSTNACLVSALSRETHFHLMVSHEIDAKGNSEMAYSGTPL